MVGPTLIVFPFQKPLLSPLALGKVCVRRRKPAWYAGGQFNTNKAGGLGGAGAYADCEVATERAGALAVSCASSQRSIGRPQCS